MARLEEQIGSKRFQIDFDWRDPLRLGNSADRTHGSPPGFAGQGIIEPPVVDDPPTPSRSGFPFRNPFSPPQQNGGGGGDELGQGLVSVPAEGLSIPGQGVVLTEEESQKKFRWAFGWGDHLIQANGDVPTQPEVRAQAEADRRAAGLVAGGARTTEEEIALDEMLEELSTNSLSNEIELEDHMDVDAALQELNTLNEPKPKFSNGWNCCVAPRKQPLPSKGPKAPAPVRGGGGLPKGGKPGPSRPGGMASQMAQQKPLVKLPQKQPSPAKAKMNPTPRGKGFVWKNLWSPAQ